MKKSNIAMIMILVVLLSIALIGTYAYQIYTQETIENTFTIGDVSVKFYEKSGNEELTTGQDYALEKNKLYEKNMIVEIGENSEDCFVYIVMQNDLAPVEAEESESDKSNPNAVGYTQVSDQIDANGWTERTVQNGNNVKIYWKEIDADSERGEIEFMKEFRTKASFDYDDVRKDDKSSPVMSFTIYAIEKGSMEEDDAWALLKNEYSDKLGSY